MSTTPSPSAPGVMRRRIISGVLAGASLAAVGGLASGAFFNDHDEITGNHFDFGTLSLSTNPTKAAISFPNMQPGDIKTGTFTLTNDGSLDLRTFGASKVDNQVAADALRLTVLPVKDAATCTSAYVTANKDDFATKSLTNLGTVAGANIGQYALQAHTSKVLCVQVEFPNLPTVQNDLMGKGVDATFAFDSVQNNAG